MKKINLVKMKAGEKGTVIEIEGGSNLEKRLAVMGISIGKSITKSSAFLMRGPVTIKSGRTVVALGHGMAAKVWVNTIKV